MKLGSEEFIIGSSHNKNTAVYISVDDEILGYYSVDNVYRQGLQELINDATHTVRASTRSRLWEYFIYS